MELYKIFSDAIKKMIEVSDLDSFSNFLGCIALLSILNIKLKDGDKND